MQQVQIKKLLEEAAVVTCTEQRRAEILRELENETEAWKRRIGCAFLGPGTPEGALFGLMTNLYQFTLANRPEKLPGLFPFFAAVCGGDDMADQRETFKTGGIRWEYA